MIRFILGAALLNAVPLILFLRLRHRVARWPMPGLWWLAAGLLTLVLTLLLAKATL